MNQIQVSNTKEVQIDSSQDQIKASGNYYFGSFSILLNASEELKMQFRFKHQLVSQQLSKEQITPIQRQQYQTSRLQLNITNQQLTTALKLTFGNVKKLAIFIKENIQNHEKIEIDEQKMCLIQKNSPKVDLYFSNYKVYDKNELLKEMQRFQEIARNQEGAVFLDQQILENVATQEDLLSFYVEEDFNQVREERNQQTESQDNQSQDPEEEQEEGSEDPQTYQAESHAPSEVDDFHNQQSLTYQQVFKQNQIPIYERFRNVNINCSRKEKIRLSEQMLRIGYLKEDIMKFFSGGAEQMQAEANHTPDYRNPATDRYKEIHMIVAKKQFQRQNQLHRRHGLPPVQELPQYRGQIIRSKPREALMEKKIRDLLIRMIKEKKLKRLDLIQLQMRRNGVEASLPYLKKLVEDMKQKSLQRKRTQVMSKGTNEISVDE